jgi:hypothetical protein
MTLSISCGLEISYRSEGYAFVLLTVLLHIHSFRKASHGVWEELILEFYEVDVIASWPLAKIK